jgi:hypothetical protein
MRRDVQIEVKDYVRPAEPLVDTGYVEVTITEQDAPDEFLLDGPRTLMASPPFKGQLVIPKEWVPIMREALWEWEQEHYL